MVPQTGDDRASSAKGFWVLFLGSVALIPLSLAIGWFDTATELAPAHEVVAEACMGVAALGGLVSCGLCVFLTRTLAPIQRVMLPLVLLFECTIGVFLVANHASAIVEGLIDFPVGKTVTSNTLVRISRAYQTHGKGTSQYIQTMPIWSTLEVSEADFTFMRNHRAPEDPALNPDEISSRGYFCAKVTLQQSGQALRILHAGSRKLPEGAVVVCPLSGHR